MQNKIKNNTTWRTFWTGALDSGVVIFLTRCITVSLESSPDGLSWSAPWIAG